MKGKGGNWALGHGEWRIEIDIFINCNPFFPNSLPLDINASMICDPSCA
jgi:hypothetical protein